MPTIDVSQILNSEYEQDLVWNGLIDRLNRVSIYDKYGLFETHSKSGIRYYYLRTIPLNF